MGQEEMLSLVLLRGKQPSVGRKKKRTQVCGIKGSNGQKRKEIRRLEQWINE
jgi:hypothetical protein